ncbi:hypothetical protein [Burkholderia multivorans]|uniref:hypothetical protein n=1 Tax=Burkholderia multivorans TaxID=87883 RepID=UPI00286A1D46|nr:hypothetical protein [Burkholderia multivorans]
MNDQQQIRADALTDRAKRLIQRVASAQLAVAELPPGMPRTAVSDTIDEARAFARAILAASPISQPAAAPIDPTDPGYDVETLREHIRHLERRVRQLSAPSPADERAAFEAWRDKRAFNLPSYGGLAEAYAWDAWQARASSPNAAGAEGIEPTMPSNEVLTARVADLLHLLSFATIHTPSDGDEPQIRRALHDIKAMIAAAPASAPVGLTEQAIVDAVTKWFPDRAYQAPFFARELLKGDKQ